MANKPKSVPRAIFLIPPDVQLLDLAGVALVFGKAEVYGAPYEILFCSSEKLVQTIGNLQLANLVHYSEIEICPTDTLLVPGFEEPVVMSQGYRRRNKKLFAWIRDAVERQALVCSVCSGSYLLAEAGVLDGCDCATHWTCFDDMQERFPQLNIVRDRLFVQSRPNVYTSAGVTSGIDLALHILKERHGPKLAFQVARRLVVYMRRNGNTDQGSVYLKYRNHVDDVVHAAQDYLIKNIQDKNTIDDLAEGVNSSPRNLTRKFKLRTGLTIGQYLSEIRLERARELLENTECTVEHVAQECGFSGARQLRNLFHKKYSRPPRAV
ncbi:GlxA family transcriptional regulator [Puniceicoccaceae bacterium K14]|nr:GlxA family transcriptional regulator [Puniceicoccaceae bacterium K14]